MNILKDTRVNIRKTKYEDLPDIEIVLEETGLFPREMLSGMIGR